ncbi:hypothetical protein H5410_004333, partial [Solanum commersonii]
MVSDEDIARAESLFREPNPNPNPTFISIVQEFQCKLRYDLAHKVDFIRAQIQYVFNRQQSQSQPQLHQNHHFAVDLPSHHPNFHSPHYRPDFGWWSKWKKKKRGGPGGLNKLCGVTPELQTIVWRIILQPFLYVVDFIVKQMWAYISKHNLQDPNNKMKVICNDVILETDFTNMFKMNRLLAKHTTQNPKRAKIEEESVPVVIISEALANFLGISESEMSQAEVLRQVWEYIKLNQLEMSGQAY